MKNLKITEYQHDRIKSGSDREGLPVGSFTDAILEFALSRYEAGEIKIAPPTPPRAEFINQLQPEEVEA